jgi:hypothetical protein
MGLGFNQARHMFKKQGDIQLFLLFISKCPIASFSIWLKHKKASNVFRDCRQFCHQTDLTSWL